MYINGCEGVDIGLLKLFLLLYADDIVIFAETEKGLQQGLHVLHSYCERWKLIVNTNKTKIMIFRKSGLIRENLKFNFNDTEVEIVNHFTYLGIVFTTGGSFIKTFESLKGQA